MHLASRPQPETHFPEREGLSTDASQETALLPPSATAGVERKGLEHLMWWWVPLESTLCCSRQVGLPLTIQLGLVLSWPLTKGIYLPGLPSQPSHHRSHIIHDLLWLCVNSRIKWRKPLNGRLKTWDLTCFATHMLCVLSVFSNPSLTFFPYQMKNDAGWSLRS